MAYVWIDVVVLNFIFSVEQKFQKGIGRKMVLIAVETGPAGSKSLSTDDSMMHFLGATKKGSVIMPKVVKLIGPSSALAEELYPFIIQSAAASSVRLNVLVSGSTSAPVARRDYRASCCRPAKHWRVVLILLHSFVQPYLSVKVACNSIEKGFVNSVESFYK